MQKIKDLFLSGGPWPIVVLIAIGAIVFTLISIFAPPGVREALFGANGLVMTLVGLMLRSPLHGLDGGDESDKEK